MAPEAGARNTLRVLECAGPGQGPGGGGRGRADGPARPVCVRIHGDDGLGNCGLPGRAGGAGLSAPEQILRLGRERPGELTLVAVGPLTNLAIALLLEPSLPGRLREVVMMGGASIIPGNVTSHAEANIWHDPEAAELVLRGAVAGHAGAAGRDAPDGRGRRLAGPAGRRGQRHGPVRRAGSWSST